MADDSFFLIDIDKILASKAGKKAKYVPGFLVSYLKKIVHQEEINEHLLNVKEKRGVPFSYSAFFSLASDFCLSFYQYPLQKV